MLKKFFKQANGDFISYVWSEKFECADDVKFSGVTRTRSEFFKEVIEKVVKFDFVNVFQLRYLDRLDLLMRIIMGCESSLGKLLMCRQNLHLAEWIILTLGLNILIE